MKYIAPAPMLKDASDLVEVRKAFSDLESFLARTVYGESFGTDPTDGKYLELSNGDRVTEAADPLTIPFRDANGALPGNITGNAPTATLAATATLATLATDCTALNSDRSVTKEPTGFVAGCIVSYDSSTRKVTLTGTVEAYWRGVKIAALVSGWVSDAHTATTGPWFLEYNGSAFTWSQTAWSFDKLQIAYVYYGSTHKWGQRECHGFMPHDCHEADHNTIGTWRKSGGDLSGYTLSSTTAAERRPLVSAAVVHDEDLETTIAELASESYTQYYLSGAGASANFVTAAADIVPLSTANPYWNQYTGGAWQQTLMANNSYMNIWLIALPVSADSGSQAYRFLWMQGQSNGNLTSETARTSQELNLGELTSLSPEIVFLAKVLIRYTAADWTIESVTNLLGSRYSQVATPGGSFLSSVSVDANYLDGDGTAGDQLTLVDNPIPDSTYARAAWPLTDAGTVAVDATGEGKHGTITGTTQVDGKYNKARYFNGSTDYIETVDIRHPTALTYAAWVRVDAWPANDAVAMIIARTGVDWYLDFYTSGTNYYMFHVWKDSAGTTQTNGFIVNSFMTVGVWHRIVATHDGTYSRIYIDGILRATSAASSMQAEASQSSAAYFIGAYNGAGSNVLNGALQHVRIDSRAWSAAEVRGDWEAGGQFIPGYRLPDYRQDNGLSATKTFYAASSSGGTVNVLNTVVIDKGLITSWTQA